MQCGVLDWNPALKKGISGKTAEIQAKSGV